MNTAHTTLPATPEPVTTPSVTSRILLLMTALPITSTRNAIVAKTVASEVKARAMTDAAREELPARRKQTANEVSSATKARPQAGYYAYRVSYIV